MIQFVVPLFLLTSLRAADGYFPLRAEPPPKEWKTSEINEGLPYRWADGDIHILAWEVTEDRTVKDNKVCGRTTQILVLKRFEAPPSNERGQWLLAHLYLDKEKRCGTLWNRNMLHIPPLLPGEKMPKLTDAQLFGHEFYKSLPTDKQLKAFLREARVMPTMGITYASTISNDEVVEVNYVTTVVSGGIQRDLWKKVFGRDVSVDLFPELKKQVNHQK